MLANISWAGIGTVTEVSGGAGDIARGKTRMAGSKGAGIENNDIITTKGGITNITFQDDTKVKITENSRLLIDDFVYDPKKSDAGKLALKVGMGTVRYASGQIAKTNPQQVAIRTPTATIAVRGTDFAMTVDETGQSLVVLIPSCKEDEKVKEYELEENKCRVGKIIVETLMGSVTLDQAFQATYVASNALMPTPPVNINLIESKINNNLIIVKPAEIQLAIRESSGRGKSERDKEEQEEQARQLNQKIKEENEKIEQARILALQKLLGIGDCNPAQRICVAWERADAVDIPGRGKGVAFKYVENEHYAEIKTQGYPSNTAITITQNDTVYFELIGDGGAGGNIVNIKQNGGVIKRK